MNVGIVRKLAFVLVISSLVGSIAACSSDPEPDPSGTGTAKGKGSGNTSGDESRRGRGGDDDGDEDPGDTGGDDSPSNPGRQDPSPTKKKNGAQCEESADCASDFCVFDGDGLGMCTTTCDGDLDCDLSWRCVKLSNAPQKVCVPE